jgi:nucleoside-diphosphate-sugar epimerase
LIVLFDKWKPDVVFHLAANCFTTYNLLGLEDVLQANVTLGTHLLEVMKAYQVKHMVYAGTNWQNYDQDDYHPLNLYAATKQAFEDICVHYAQNEDIKIISLRLFDTYGIGDCRLKLLNVIKDAMQNNTQIKFIDRAIEMNFTHVCDVQNAFQKAYALQIDRIWPKSNFKKYDVRIQKSIRMDELVILLEYITGKSLDVDFKGYSPRKANVLKPHYGEILPEWVPYISLSVGLSAFLQDKGIAKSIANLEPPL